MTALLRDESRKRVGDGSGRILEELRRSIYRGELLPGEQLRQEELAGRLGVSRVPLREALLVLSNQGLLTHRKNQGFVVAKRSADELAQIFRLLNFLETELADTFVWPAEAVIKDLRALNAQMAAAIDSENWTNVVEDNHAFHAILWRQSPLNLFCDEVERVWPLAEAYIARAYQFPEVRRAAVAEHNAIVEAVAARDTDKFRRACADHRLSSSTSTASTFPSFG